ncbi:Rrf2 family transcriptional regulator [Reichenbachiella ulvae]|uniref:Rrf2 family transcriptional regulator n=1 Tax=Reichenbachiella ulvae TaxID=2980104 RepID=A0ABT3CT37_9BACT|nr:Rrf2 family transcriptional regulator [Reichenbachiella ulvae]MCV9386847.1 Rrf2 family transcriptional regulator [Reichenbachiella ulvae]
MNNTRFATALHILALLADSEEEWMRSEWIAGSINVNPVIVRKELSLLNEAGLVDSRKGKVGGFKLKKNSEDISLAEIYHVVKNSEVLGKKNLNPNPKCPIGKEINQQLDGLFVEMNDLLNRNLERKSLKKFVEQFR